MKLANTLCLVINDLHADHATTTSAPVYWFSNGRLIVSGWLVWNGGFDYTSRYHRESISPDRQHVMQVLREGVVEKAVPVQPTEPEPVLEVVVEPPLTVVDYPPVTLTHIQTKDRKEVKTLWESVRAFTAKLFGGKVTSL